MIPISHDEKADSERNKDTPEKGIKRWVFIISIDQSGCGYHKNSEVSPGKPPKTAENLRIWADSQNYSGKIGRLTGSLVCFMHTGRKVIKPFE